MSEEKVWVDTFLSTPPLGTLFVKVGNIFEKGVQNSHYHEKCDPEDEHPERYTDPNDDWIRSYGADEVEFLSDRQGREAAVEQLLAVKGRLLLPSGVPEGLKTELEALEEFQLELGVAEGEHKLVQLKPVTPGPEKKPINVCNASIYLAETKSFAGTESFAKTGSKNELYCSQDRYDIVQYLPVNIEYVTEDKVYPALLERCEYPCCPRILCEGQKCIPVGHIREKGNSFRNTSQLLFYCPRCKDFYHPSNPILRRTPGYFFRGVQKDESGKEEPYYVGVAKDAGAKLKGWPEMKIFHPTIFGLRMMS